MCFTLFSFRHYRRRILVETKFEDYGGNIVLFMQLENSNQKQNLYLPIKVRSPSKGLIA